MKYAVEQIQSEIKSLLEDALQKARMEGKIKFTQIPEYIIEVPREKIHGDYATNLAMLMAKEARMAPRKIAEIIVKNIENASSKIEKIEIAGPGFINIYLNKSWLLPVLPLIEEMGDDYGKVNIGNGKKVQVEFVSANPTGPMHMGNARGAALGDSLASLLETAGFNVSREFYINDAGNQIENFGLSLEARYLQLLGHEAEIPENGYHGEDIIEHMKEIIKTEGDRFLHEDSQKRREFFVNYALNKNLDKIKKDLKNFGVEFDVWFSEKSLHESGKLQQTIDILKQKGLTYEKDGALWFAASKFGAEKDEVLIRQNGIPTYFAADIAYHKDKLDRGFEEIIDIWGADHHGHVARMKGALEALGYDPERLKVIIIQLVRLYRNGELARMSKRTGKAVTLADLVEEVGKDAARFFFNMRSADTHLDFDLDLAVSKSADNPVYYVQYAHARICSILRQVEERGIKIPSAEEAYLELLEEPSEIELLKKLAEYPEEITRSAQKLEPYHLTRYAMELASLFHTFYNSCRVITDDQKLMGARLVIIKGVKQVLKNTLTILGISAPERM
ncbi:MAG: arginyl-tRNA synthetase [Thermosediminibacterales bacterium]|nr:arginyl-tRNA synthetase [Thermosediminibacterales bacterium]